MPALDILGTFADPLNQDQGASKLINCRVALHAAIEGKLAKARLIGSPGLTQICKPSSSPCIVLCHALGTIWSGHEDGSIYHHVETSTPVYAGSTPTDADYHVIRMAEDRTALCIAANSPCTDMGNPLDDSFIETGGSGYTATIGGGVVNANFQGTINFDPSSVCNTDNYTIWAGASNTYANQTDKMYSSAPLAPASVDANAYATAEARADELLDVVTLGRTFWAFGTRTVEMWYDQGGSSDFAFTAFTNSLLEVGLAARRTLANLHGKAMWVGTDRRIWIGQGQSGQAISPPWVDMLLQQSVLRQLTAYMYSQGGDEFYVLTHENLWTIEMAVSTQTWIYRETFGRNDHAGRCAIEHDGGVTYVGLVTGEICRLDLTTASEPAGQMHRQIVTMWVGLQEGRHTIDKIDITSYMGPDAGAFTLDWSEDQMQTWKGLRSIIWPQPGTRRAIARALGTSRRRQVRINYNGPMAPFQMDEFFVMVSQEGQ